MADNGSGGDGGTVLLIDGDTVAFIAAAACQTVFEDADGNFSHSASGEDVKACIDNLMLGFKRAFKAREMVVFLSHAINWRHTFAADYKENRKGSAAQRPMALQFAKGHLMEEYAAFTTVNLEADDAISIWSHEDMRGDEFDRFIIVGRDKDFMTIPGLHHRIGDEPGKAFEVTREMAYEFYMAQILAGDRVDNIKGCPGIGMKRAKDIVGRPVRMFPTKGVITRGKNKGRETVKWLAEPTENMWECIVTHYEKAGLTEADARLAAALLRILRAGEYDFETGKVSLMPADVVARGEDL